MLICHPYIFFGEMSVKVFGKMSVKVFGPFFNWVVCFLLLSFKSSLHNLNNISLQDVSFANVFFSLWLIFSFP